MEVASHTPISRLLCTLMANLFFSPRREAVICCKYCSMTKKLTPQRRRRASDRQSTLIYLEPGIISERPISQNTKYPQLWYSIFSFGNRMPSFTFWRVWITFYGSSSTVLEGMLCELKKIFIQKSKISPSFQENITFWVTH